MQTTINPDELNKFEKMADDWWNPNGKFKPLHQYNPVRVEYIKTHIIQHFNLDPKKKFPLEGIKILDIGCGGGLLCEPLALLGASMKGIDAVEKNTKIASLHAEKNHLKIQYETTTIEQLVESKEIFDIVIALEIIEHVEHPDFFIQNCLKPLKKNGLFFGSTINKTATSYLLSIIGAEYILNWLPKGTHDWKKFVSPSDFIEWIETNQTAKVLDATGVNYTLLKQKFYLDRTNLKNNYILMAQKN